MNSAACPTRWWSASPARGTRTHPWFRSRCLHHHLPAHPANLCRSSSSNGPKGNQCSQSTVKENCSPRAALTYTTCTLDSWNENGCKNQIRKHHSVKSDWTGTCVKVNVRVMLIANHAILLYMLYTSIIEGLKLLVLSSSVCSLSLSVESFSIRAMLRLRCHNEFNVFFFLNRIFDILPRKQLPGAIERQSEKRVRELEPEIIRKSLGKCAMQAMMPDGWEENVLELMF